MNRGPAEPCGWILDCSSQGHTPRHPCRLDSPSSHVGPDDGEGAVLPMTFWLPGNYHEGPDVMPRDFPGDWQPSHSHSLSQLDSALSSIASRKVDMNSKARRLLRVSARDQRADMQGGARVQGGGSGANTRLILMIGSSPCPVRLEHASIVDLHNNTEYSTEYSVRSTNERIPPPKSRA
jgi:hypothetical protein